MAHAKQIAGIDCNATARDAMRLVLITRLEEMCALRDKALDWGDPEGVHDMRVASRRLRSELRDFIPYVRKRHLASSLQQIKAIADALGRVRDQDVAIMALERLATKAPAEVSLGILHFADVRKSLRDEARKELAQTLDPDSLAQIQSLIQAAIDAATAIPPSRGKRARQVVHLTTVPSYREVARSIILVRLDELEELSDSLFYPLRVKPLHETRIAAKRLRYALELFEQCWGEALAIFAKKATALQTSLGELHDCDVWIESFGDDLARANRHGATVNSSAGKDSGTACVWLLSHFIKVRTKHLRNALSQWSEWQTEGYSARLRGSIQAECHATASRSAQ